MKSISKFSIHQVIQRPLSPTEGAVITSGAFDNASKNEFLDEDGQEKHDADDCYRQRRH